MVCGLFWFMAGSAFAVDVTEPRWGFDGRVRPQRFNLLTLTVDNPTPQPVEFELVLQKTTGVNPIDTPLVEPVFLAPGTRRTVQFYPYVTNDWDSWRLYWPKGGIELARPRLSRRGARVLLDSSDVISESQASVQRFPENQFPSSVTGTDTLQAVVLDHAPNWDEARRTAFLDWLYRGGTVLILLGSNGKFPEFPAALNELNAPLDSIRYGSGLIRKVARTRGQFSRDEARMQFRQLPNQIYVEPVPTEPGIAPPTQFKDDEEEEDALNRSYGFHDGGSGLTAQSFLDELKKMTRPEHNWILLHLMFWVYIVLIFPGCYLIGLKRNDFRAVYLTLIAVVAVFSLAFGVVGQRGYGESTTVNSVAIVQPLPNGQLDVAQWSNAFVTGGATYDVHHEGTGALYSTCQETEAVNVFIKNGADALFRVDIPPFSSRDFAHRIKVPGVLPAVSVEKSVADETGLKELALKLDAAFPATDEMIVLYRDRFYSVVRKGSEVTLRSNIGSVPAYLRVEQNQTFFPGFGYSEEATAPQQRYQRLFTPLVTRSLNVRSAADAQAIRWSPDRIRLMYYADILPSLKLQHPRFTNQKGKALYCVDLPLQEEMPNAK